MQTCRTFQGEDMVMRRPRHSPAGCSALACSVRPRHWPKSPHRSRCHAVPCPAAERATFTPCKAVLAVSRTRILVSLHVPCTTSSRWTPSSLEILTVHVPIESSIKRILGSLDCSALKLTHCFKLRVRVWITQGRSRNLQAFRRSRHSKQACSCILNSNPSYYVHC